MLFGVGYLAWYNGLPLTTDCLVNTPLMLPWLLWIRSVITGPLLPLLYPILPYSYIHPLSTALLPVQCPPQDPE